jgi:hypothetical protein
MKKCSKIMWCAKWTGPREVDNFLTSIVGYSQDEIWAHFAKTRPDRTWKQLEAEGLRAVRVRVTEL